MRKCFWAGFGESDKPAASHRPEFSIDQATRFVDAAGVARAHFVGSSMGASLVVR